MQDPSRVSFASSAVAVAIPSRSYETFGYVALEAFSVGTPVVARRVGALPEIVEESGGGIGFEHSRGLRRPLRPNEMQQELAGARRRDQTQQDCSEVRAAHQFGNEQVRRCISAASHLSLAARIPVRRLWQSRFLKARSARLHPVHPK